MIRPLTSALLLSTALLAACGDDAPTTDDPDAGEPDAGEPVECAEVAGAIALRASSVTGAAVPATRLVVVYFQFIDDVEPYPTPVIAYDAPLAALPADGEACAQIPLAEIEAPADDAYLLCARTCVDLTDPSCACPDGEGLATAYVVAVIDGDESGGIEADEIESGMIGAGYLGVVTAPEGYEPPGLIAPLFPEGVEAGTQPYRVIPGGNDNFDALGTHQPPTVYPLHLCPPDDDTCDLPFPNLT